MSFFSRIKKTLGCLWYYLWGHFFAFFYYKKKYYYGKWFKGKCHGLFAPGWKWICIDTFKRKYNPKVPWPCSPFISIGNWKNIHFHPDDINNFQVRGIYYQTWGDADIFIGEGTYIAQNVCLITQNHNLYNPEKRGVAKDIKLGKKCWIGANAVILPGVILGDHTVVGAGSIVTKSFPDGHCVIVGNPAKKIKDLETELCENDGK